MFNRSSFVVKRKAKKYKNWLEKIMVYPYPFEVSGGDYFLVDYVKLNHTIGGAVFSDTEENVHDVKKAHRNLYLFYRLHEKILEGKVRAQVNFDFFKEPLKKMDDNRDPKWEKPHRLINRLLDLQLIYRKTYDEYWEHIEELKNNKLSLTEEDMKVAIDTAATLETVQFHVVREISENMKILNEWKELMQSKGLWNELKRDQQVFYTQLMQNEEFMKEEAKLAKSENYERAFKLNQEAMSNYMKKEQKSDSEILRYPLI